MLLLNLFVNNILPVLLLSGTGFALEKTLHVDARPLGRVIFYILSPVLVFNLHTSNELPFDRIGLMVGFTATGSLIISGLAFFNWKIIPIGSRRFDHCDSNQHVRERWQFMPSCGQCFFFI
jgi:predicted permease